MKKLSTILCTLALLFIGVGGVNSVYATKKYASISVATGATWNPETNTMSFEEVNSWQILLTGLPAGNIKAYTNINATLSSMSNNINHIRLRIKDTSDNYADYNLVEGENIVDLATLAKNNPNCNFESIADITLWSPTSAADNETVGSGDDAASVKITNFYIERPFVFAFDATGTAVVDVTDLKATGCYSLNQQTGVLTNSYVAETNQNGSVVIEFPSAVDMSSVYGFKVNYTGTMVLGGIWLNNWDYMFGNNVGGRNDIGNSMANSQVTREVNKWRWDASSTTGEMTITSVEFYSSVMSASPGEEASMSVLTNYHKNGEIFETTGYSPSYRVNESTGVAFFGVDWNGENCQNCSDVEGYKAIRVYHAGDNTPRAMFFNSTANGQQAFNFTWNANGYYELLLSTVYNSVSNYKLISIRPASGSSSSCSGIYMVVENPIYNYNISGNGVLTASVINALTDATATSINATGLTNTSAIELISANPNCLFIANSGKLSNNNVIVSDACAQLALTDGYPFKAPVAFTATAAPTYNRAFTANATTTVCLPFALTAAEASSLGTFYELSSVDGSTLTFTPVAAPEANKAYLVKTTATGLALSETGKSIVVTPADLGATVSGVEFIGTLAATEIPASDESTSYYAFNNGSLVKIVTNAATLPAFRGYFKVTGATSSRSLNISFSEGTTALTLVNSEKRIMDSDVYDLQGRRVAQPTKGLYIVNGKKVIK